MVNKIAYKLHWWRVEKPPIFHGRHCTRLGVLPRKRTVMMVCVSNNEGEIGSSQYDTLLIISLILRKLNQILFCSWGGSRVVHFASYRGRRACLSDNYHYCIDHHCLVFWRYVPLLPWPLNVDTLKFLNNDQMLSITTAHCGALHTVTRHLSGVFFFRLVFDIQLWEVGADSWFRLERTNFSSAFNNLFAFINCWTQYWVMPSLSPSMSTKLNTIEAILPQVQIPLVGDVWPWSTHRGWVIVSMSLVIFSS